MNPKYERVEPDSKWCGTIKAEGEIFSHSRDYLNVAEGQRMPPHLPPAVETRDPTIWGRQCGVYLPKSLAYERGMSSLAQPSLVTAGLRRDGLPNASKEQG